jgi:hypothetical protein
MTSERGDWAADLAATRDADAAYLAADAALAAEQESSVTAARRAAELLADPIPATPHPAPRRTP